MRFDDMRYVLVAALVIGMSAASLPPILRALPLVQRWMMRGVKPWVCDLCMSFWSTLLTTLFWASLGVPALAGLPAFVVTFFIVRKNGDPLHEAPSVAELVDSGGDAELLAHINADPAE